MRWMLILSLVVGVVTGASASVPQVKDASADLSRRNVRAEAEAKAAFDRGRAAHNARKTDEAVSAFEQTVALDPNN